MTISKGKKVYYADSLYIINEFENGLVTLQSLRDETLIIRCNESSPYLRPFFEETV